MSVTARLLRRLAQTTIRRQLSLGAAAVVSITALLSAAVMVSSEYYATRTALLTDLQVQARMIAANSSAALVFKDARAAQEILQALQASADVSGARLLGTDGRLLAEYRAQTGDQTRPKEVELNEPVTYLGREYGRLVIDADLRRLRARLLLYALSALGMVVLAVALALLLFSRVVRLITRPVNELIALMQQVAREGDYSRRSNIATHNEIGDIARSVNTMLGEIEQRQQALSHELEERRRTEAQLDHLVRHDTLTQLGNRHALMLRMQQVQQQCTDSRQSCGLLLLDLDNFKLVNDSLGHRAGDELLVQIADRLQALLGSELPVYRLGGDEFAIITLGDDPERACQTLSGLIVERLRASFDIEGHKVYATMSVGFALYPQHASELQELLRQADLALYAAKNQGRDTWRAFTPQMRERAEQRLHLEANLRSAIEREEFHLVYQAQVDMVSGRLCGVEALLRWRHSLHGVVSPLDFIPLAEETGLIVPIGEWVLRQACKDGARLLALGVDEDFLLAINLAPRQLSEPALVAAVARALADTGFPAHHLELEVTESAMTERIEVVAERMHAIAKLGVSFAVDDFGAGASSLNYLRRLPLRKLKIDRSFVRDIPGCHDDCAIAAAIIAIGARLRMQVLAEGVETFEQLEFLRSQGCTLAQGFYFSRPQLLEDFLADWGRRDSSKIRPLRPRAPAPLRM